MLEVDDLVKDNRISVLIHGASILIEKSGGNRLPDETPVAAVIDGKAQVYFGEKKVEIGRGREVVLSEQLATQSLTANARRSLRLDTCALNTTPARATKQY